MGMIDTNELKAGVKVIFDKAPYVVVKVDFVKPGKGATFYKTRVQNLLTGNTLDKNLRSGEKIEEADVVESEMTYLYREADAFVFMDSTSFEQYRVAADAISDKADFLMENMSVSLMLWNNEAINVRLPHTLKLKITYTEPAIQGDTQSRVMKEAELETGAKVQVPTFCKTGDVISVNTETREYLGRVNG